MPPASNRRLPSTRAGFDQPLRAFTPAPGTNRASPRRSLASPLGPFAASNLARPISSVQRPWGFPLQRSFHALSRTPLGSPAPLSLGSTGPLQAVAPKDGGSHPAPDHRAAEAAAALTPERVSSQSPVFPARAGRSAAPWHGCHVPSLAPRTLPHVAPGRDATSQGLAPPRSGSPEPSPLAPRSHVRGPVTPAAVRPERQTAPA